MITAWDRTTNFAAKTFSICLIQANLVNVLETKPAGLNESWLLVLVIEGTLIIRKALYFQEELFQNSISSEMLFRHATKLTDRFDSFGVGDHWLLSSLVPMFKAAGKQLQDSIERKFLSRVDAVSNTGRFKEQFLQSTCKKWQYKRPVRGNTSPLQASDFYFLHHLWLLKDPWIMKTPTKLIMEEAKT